VTKNPRGDPYMNDTEKVLGYLVGGEQLENVKNSLDEVYYEYGSPFITVCRTCGEFYICLLIRRTPLGGEDYNDEVLGIIVFVDNTYPLDGKVELVVKKATVIRTYGKKTGFYVPREYLELIAEKLCGRPSRNERIGVYAMKIEEATIFLD